MKTDSSNLSYQKALDRVRRIKGFYTNLMLYVLVIPVLGYINYQSSDFPWALIPAVAWGFGLLMNGMDAFGYHPLLGKNWESRKIKELMAQDEVN